MTAFDAELQQLAKDMLETLPVAFGIGLAAPQVGRSIRMVLIDVSHTGTPETPAPAPFFLVNPVIVSGEGSASLAEGCLSVPGVRVEVPRLAKIRVTAQDETGAKRDFEAEGLLAIVIQHEMDHLDGKLIPDYIGQGCKWWRDEDVPEDRQLLD